MTAAKFKRRWQAIFQDLEYGGVNQPLEGPSLSLFSDSWGVVQKLGRC